MSRSTLLATVATTLTLILHLPAADAIIINVPSDYPTIQEALDVAEDGDVILVASGTYTGEGNYDIDFLGKALTVRSAMGPFFCEIDANDLGRIFVFENGETNNSVIDGFTLSNGNTDDGGAILCDNGSSPTIQNCRLVRNEAVRGGAVFAGVDSHPRIESCTFRDNLAIEGGAIAAIYGSPYINDCRFVRNSATQGGAIHGRNNWGFQLEEPVIEDCTFLNNTAASSIFGQCLEGGAIYTFLSSPYASRCIFQGNEVTGGPLQDGFGGAIYSNKGQPVWISCLFDGNRAERGGAIFDGVDSSGGRIVNCTIVNNESELEGGGVWVVSAGTSLANLVFWGNQSGTGQGDQVWDAGGPPTYLFNSIVEGGFENGFNVFDLDPEFLDPAAGDYRVSQTSPCVDLGDVTYPCDPCVPEGETLDLNHDPRVVCDDIDAGAYEVQFLVCEE